MSNASSHDASGLFPPLANQETETQKLTTSPTTRTLQLYRRTAYNRKHLFTESSSAPARYFIINPTPHRHADTWKPVFYRGDNPKYDQSSKPVARAFRKSWWGSFRIELGDGVAEVLDNERRVRERKSYETKQKWRRAFCMGETPPKKELEDERDVVGFVMAVELKRDRFFGRTMVWEIGGERYNWTGTRRFLPNSLKKMKGVSHDLKLANSRGFVVATFEKDYKSNYRRSEKTDGPPNKKKAHTGTLRFDSSLVPAVSASDIAQAKLEVRDADGQDGNEPASKQSGKPDKRDKNLNLDGPHSGDLIDEIIALTCWTVVEAEHRIRYKIFDVLEEIGEHASEAGGG